MNEQTAVEPTSAEQIISHLKEILMATNQHGSALKASFSDVAKGKRFNKQEFMLLLTYANETGRGSIDNNASTLWHFFKDPLAKRVSFSDPTNLSTKNAMDVVIFSKWVTKNFRTIMGLEEQKTPPQIFSKISDVSDFQTFLSYLEQTIVPSLEQALCQEHRLSPTELGVKLKIHEKELIESNALGVEILMPIPPKKWLAANPK